MISGFLSISADLNAAPQNELLQVNVIEQSLDSSRWSGLRPPQSIENSDYRNLRGKKK